MESTSTKQETSPIELLSCDKILSYSAIKQIKELAVESELKRFLCSVHNEVFALSDLEQLHAPWIRIEQSVSLPSF